MNTERNAWKCIVLFIIRYFVVFTFVLYMVRLGITALIGLKLGMFKFDYCKDFFSSIKEGLVYGVLFGIGEWAMRKAKKFEKDKKNNNDK